MKNLTNKVKFHDHIKNFGKELIRSSDVMMLMWLELTDDDIPDNYDRFNHLRLIPRHEAYRNHKLAELSVIKNRNLFQSDESFQAALVGRIPLSFKESFFFGVGQDDLIIETAIKLYRETKEFEDLFSISIKEKKSLYSTSLYLALVATFYLSFKSINNKLGIGVWDFFTRIEIFRFSSMMNYSELWGYRIANGELPKGALEQYQSMKQFHSMRTALSTKTKKEKRQIAEKYVYDEFLKMIKNSSDRKVIGNLSEHKLATMIKKQIMSDLQERGIKKISEETIIDILRKRDKNKFKWYPWEEKKTSKM